MICVYGYQTSRTVALVDSKWLDHGHCEGGTTTYSKNFKMPFLKSHCE